MFDIKIGTRLIVSLLAVIVFSTAIAVIGYTQYKVISGQGRCDVQAKYDGH